MKGSGTGGFRMDCGGYKVRSPYLSARNARRIERKKRDKGYALNTQYMGREGQEEEREGDCAIL